MAKTVTELGGTVQAGLFAEGGAGLAVQLLGVTSRDAVPSHLLPAAAPARA